MRESRVCPECQKPFVPKTKRQLMCGNACKFVRLQRTCHNNPEWQKRASERMKSRNPMRHEENRAKMRDTLVRIGHQPKERGGNGKPPPAEQFAMSNAMCWPMELPIPTKVPRKLKTYPTCYRVDIGSRHWKVAIEIDGHSHDSLARKASDRKKQAFLESNGWTVLRFTNKEVTENLNGCVQAVWSSISKSRSGPTTSPTASSSTTAT